MKKALLLITFLVVILVILPAVSASIPNPGERTPIKHVINIYFENHTFDNFFGTYPENPSSPDQSLISNISKPINLLDNRSLLNSLTPIPSGTFSTPDPIEGYTAYHIDWNHGAMNQFVNGSGPYSMTYYTSSQLGPMWDLAEEYGLGDRYFAPTISESAPNTLYYLAGFSPVFNDYGPPPSIPISETIFGELNKYNISWGIYNSANYKSFDMSQYIQGIGAYSNDINSWNTFLNQLGNGTLPSVSYVFSQGGNGYDMGAPSSILKGELWLMSLINHIEQSPIWNSTAVFITWDDPGGYFDQVPPPVVAGDQLGMRLPLIVVSPYAKENYVSNTVLTHSSILAFIDYNWKIPALNNFVANVNVPLDFFDFNESRAPMTFSFGTQLPLPTDLSFNISQNQSELNLSSTFPMSPQEPLSSLKYSDHGEINYTLASLGSSILVKKDITYSPIYSSPFFLLLLIIACVVIVEYLPRRKI
ncbi:MAG: alkaline phosphatase family protein [Thermoplasmatales archaeon]